MPHKRSERSPNTSALTALLNAGVRVLMILSKRLFSGTSGLSPASNNSRADQLPRLSASRYELPPAPPGSGRSVSSGAARPPRTALATERPVTASGCGGQLSTCSSRSYPRPLGRKTVTQRRLQRPAPTLPKQGGRYRRPLERPVRHRALHSTALGRSDDWVNRRTDARPLMRGQRSTAFG